MNLRRGEVAQGGSTLTQQLVKNLVLCATSAPGTASSARRALAIMLECALRQVADPRGVPEHDLPGTARERGAIYGVGAAARSYFGKDVERLGLAEAALLAGMIRAPNSHSPAQNPERARERRGHGARRAWRQLGFDRRAGAGPRLSRERRARPAGARVLRLLAPYFLDYVRAQHRAAPSRRTASWAAASAIYTTLDPGAPARGRGRADPRAGPAREPPPAPPPDRDAARAAGGGGRHRPVSRARSRRWSAAVTIGAGAVQPRGAGQDASRARASSRSSTRRGGLRQRRRVDRGPPPLDDSPLEMRRRRASCGARSTTTEGVPRNVVTARRALEESLNVPTVRAGGLETGLERVVQVAQR